MPNGSGTNGPNAQLRTTTMRWKENQERTLIMLGLAALAACTNLRYGQIDCSALQGEGALERGADAQQLCLADIAKFEGSR